MRIEQIVSEMVYDRLLRDKIHTLCGAVGGWERWFQLELVYYIATHRPGMCTVELESASAYPDTECRADLFLRSARASQSDTFVELKCQTRDETPARFVQQINNDLRKMDASRSNCSRQLIAVVRTERDAQNVARELGQTPYAQAIWHRFEGLTVPFGFFSCYRDPNN